MRDRITFKSKKELKYFILSNKCQDYLTELKQDLSEYNDKTETAPIECQGHGSPFLNKYELYSASTQLEINRIQNLILYFNKKIPKPGYLFKYDKNRQSVYTEINLKGDLKKHPDFLEYIKDETDPDSLFPIWLNYVKNPNSLNAMFKYSYTKKLTKLIPDGIKLI